MASDYWWVRDDTGPTNTTTLKDRDGAAVNLAGATVRFVMRPVSSTTAKVAAAAEIVAAGSGTVRYVRQAADTDTAGDFIAEYEVTYSDGTIQTFPESGHIRVYIRADLD